jgi:hypothetical protein
MEVAAGNRDLMKEALLENAGKRLVMTDLILDCLAK